MFNSAKTHSITPMRKTRTMQRAAAILATTLYASYGMAQVQYMPMPMPPLHRPQVNILTVNGFGTAEIDTPIAAIQLAIESTALTADLAQKNMAKKSDAIVRFLKSKNVQALKTSGIRLNSNYEYENNQQKLKGYTASYTLTFQVAQEDSGQYLDESIRLGATRIDSIQFISTAKNANIAKLQAIASAVQDAKDKASSALNALNMKQKQVLHVRIEDAATQGSTQFDAMPMMRVAKAMAAPTPIVSGTDVINANVQLEISYTDK